MGWIKYSRIGNAPEIFLLSKNLIFLQNPGTYTIRVHLFPFDHQKEEFPLMRSSTDLPKLLAIHPHSMKFYLVCMAVEQGSDNTWVLLPQRS